MSRRACATWTSRLPSATLPRMVSLRSGLLLGVMVCAGCFVDRGLLDATGTTSGATTSGTTSSATSGTTSDPTTTDAGSSGSSGSLTTGITSGTSTTAVTTTGPCTDLPDQPLDAKCGDPSGCGCASGHCVSTPLFDSVCGECLDEDDCPDGGCTLSNPLTGTGSRCNEGNLGDGCNTDAACNQPTALHCGLVLSAKPVLEVYTCGECETHADCVDPNMPFCNPSYDLAELTGVLRCVAKESVPNDQGCASNEACESGFCGKAESMGIVKLGVCGECLSDADCNRGKTCTPPVLDINNAILLGAVCE